MKDIFSQEFVTMAYGREMYEEGVNMGRAEGHADVARNMLKMNFPPEQIAQITGMTPEAIMAL